MPYGLLSRNFHRRCLVTLSENLSLVIPPFAHHVPSARILQHPTTPVNEDWCLKQRSGSLPTNKTDSHIISFRFDARGVALRWGQAFRAIEGDGTGDGKAGRFFAEIG